MPADWDFSLKLQLSAAFFSRSGAVVVVIITVASHQEGPGFKPVQHLSGCTAETSINLTPVRLIDVAKIAPESEWLSDSGEESGGRPASRLWLAPGEKKP